MTPPIAGPRLRAMLNPTALAMTAGAICVRGTWSPMDACQAGAFGGLQQGRLLEVRCCQPANLAHRALPDQFSITVQDTRSTAEQHQLVGANRGRLHARIGGLKKSDVRGRRDVYVDL